MHPNTVQMLILDCQMYIVNANHCVCVKGLVFVILITDFNNITFIGFGSQEGWITTDIKTYTTNNKTMSTHQLSESDELQSATEFNAASLVQSITQNVVIYLDQN